MVTWKRLTHLDLSFAGFGVFICQQLRHLSKIYFRNLQGNDLCMNALWWISHLSSINIFAQVASTFKGEQKYASGNELAPFYFNNMVASMPTSWHALVPKNVNFSSHLIFLWISNKLLYHSLGSNNLQGQVRSTKLNFWNLNMFLSSSQLRGKIPNYLDQFRHLAYLSLYIW